MATPNPAIKGPGVLYVRAKISRPDLMDEPTYMNWYDNDHIAEIIQTSGVDSAIRSKTLHPNDQPYLAMYPMEDMAFTQGDEFRKIRVKSDLLPGSGLCYDLADNDVMYYKLIQVFDPTKKGKGTVKSFFSAQYELGPDVTPEDFDKWYREEHLDALAKCPGYLRTTRYTLMYSRSNAQSRALKGLPPTSSEPPPEPLTHMAIHEFEVPAGEIDLPKVKDITGGEWTERIAKGSKKVVHTLYNVVKLHGKGEFFHGKEL